MNFLPEKTGVGKYTGEMAEWLAGQGAEVTVVTAPPYYPEWKLQPGYRHWWYSHDPAFPGLSVVRCPVWVPARPSAVARVLHLASFALTSAPLVLGYGLRRRFDVLWTVEPTLATAPAAQLAAFIGGARTWLHVQDLEVDAAFALGITEGGVLRRLSGWIESALTRAFDRVSTISAAMRQRLLEKGVSEERLLMFRNWADTEGIEPASSRTPLRAELGIDEDTVLALYSGNMGVKQGLSILGDAAELLRDDSRIRFLFCGNGPGRGDLEARVAGLGNVQFLDLQPASRLNELLNSADIHLLPQRDAVAQLVLPSKLTGMLASGRPVVAGASAGTELAGIVGRCGLAVPAGDAAAFVEAIRTLASDAALRAELGRAARGIAEQDMAREKILATFLRDLESLVS
jgi:colanic acid biosynthesis glycosyl transferase WcaI